MTDPQTLQMLEHRLRIARERRQKALEEAQLAQARLKTADADVQRLEQERAAAAGAFCC